MQIQYEPILEKVQKHLKNFSIESSISEEKLDFELDYPSTDFLGTRDGISSVGSIRPKNSPIDYIHILKKQEYVRCDFAAGSHVGMGIHKHSWWKMRFFLSFPESFTIGPFDIGTITTIRKKRFHSEIENFVWNGYPKLTTLPPGLIRDDVSEPLYQNQRLQNLMTKCLLKERVITISRYSPSESKAKKTNSKIIIESKWKLQKELFVNGDTIEMYEKMAEIVKQTINDLKYHLT